MSARAEPPRISVVIPTYQRREACRGAVLSALEQELPALEVLVCDDGSTDGTEEEFEAWAREEPRLQYLRLPSNTGSPGPARDLGIRAASGDWVALLDSDDRWFPNKLSAQSDAILTGRYDVVASDAERASGGPYFGLERALEPPPEEFLSHNPIIVSSSVARRSSVLSAGGFRKSVLGLPINGVEDYRLWLTLAHHGAGFLVLPETLLVYNDVGPDAMSSSVARQEAGVAAVRWRLWFERPTDVAVLASALRGSAEAARWRFRGALASRKG